MVSDHLLPFWEFVPKFAYVYTLSRWLFDPYLNSLITQEIMLIPGSTTGTSLHSRLQRLQCSSSKYASCKGFGNQTMLTSSSSIHRELAGRARPVQCSRRHLRGGYSQSIYWLFKTCIAYWSRPHGLTLASQSTSHQSTLH